MDEPKVDVAVIGAGTAGLGARRAAVRQSPTKVEQQRERIPLSATGTALLASLALFAREKEIK